MLPTLWVHRTLMLKKSSHQVSSHYVQWVEHQIIHGFDAQTDRDPSLFTCIRFWPCMTCTDVVNNSLIILQFIHDWLFAPNIHTWFEFHQNKRFLRTGRANAWPNDSHSKEGKTTKKQNKMKYKQN